MSNLKATRKIIEDSESSDTEGAWHPSPGDIVCGDCHYYKSDPTFLEPGVRKNTTKHKCGKRAWRERNHVYEDCPLHAWNTNKARNHHGPELSRKRALEREEQRKAKTEEQEKKKLKKQKDSFVPDQSEAWQKFKKESGIDADVEAGPQSLTRCTDLVRTFLDNKAKPAATPPTATPQKKIDLTGDATDPSCPCGKEAKFYQCGRPGTFFNRRFWGCARGIEGCVFELFIKEPKISQKDAWKLKNEVASLKQQLSSYVDMVQVLQGQLDVYQLNAQKSQEAVEQLMNSTEDLNVSPNEFPINDD